MKREPLGRMIETFEADPEPLNVLSELALLRALLVDFLGRFDPEQRSDIDAAGSLVDGISKVVARVQRSLRNVLGRSSDLADAISMLFSTYRPARAASSARFLAYR
ncbi:MAG: hypothetical protein ACREMD_03650 [Gemmatimonadota bacterium]